MRAQAWRAATLGRRRCGLRLFRAEVADPGVGLSEVVGNHEPEEMRDERSDRRAEIVILCAFGLNNVKLLLISGIGQSYDSATGQGTVGRNYAYQTIASVNVFYPESVHIKSFMGAGALGTVIDDYNGDNFDHTGLGFVGGDYIAANSTGARPIEYHPAPPGIPRWGLAWKQAVRRYYKSHRHRQRPWQLYGDAQQLAQS